MKSKILLCLMIQSFIVNFFLIVLQVWGLDVYQLVVSFLGEYSKSIFFKNIGFILGVIQVVIGLEYNLFFCGIDGSMKFRLFLERDSMVRYWIAQSGVVINSLIKCIIMIVILVMAYVFFFFVLSLCIVMKYILEVQKYLLFNYFLKYCSKVQYI